MRILHVLNSLDRGGVETWLLHVLRTIDRSRFSTHFALHTTRGALEAEVAALGAEIHRLPPPSMSTWKVYRKRFAELMDECRPSAVHSHVYFFSGRVLQLAQKSGIPRRIAHGHTNLSWASKNPYRSGYARTMRRSIQSHATDGFGSSPETAADLFGPAWSKDSRWSVLPCGIDLTPFESIPDSDSPVSPEGLRRELGIPDGVPVIGHVGRFVAVKNHRFLVEIAHEVLKKAPETVFLFVGRGPLREQVEADIRQRGLQDRCRIVGERSDVPQLMMRVFDALILPSLLEGGSVTMFEAQAAGVPCLVSDRVPRSAQIVPGLVRTLSLTESPAAWAEALLATVTDGRRNDRFALDVMRRSPANISVCVERLQEVYERSVLASVPQP
jgi:glycosyltransferase involved in cell wall biosynthesis